MAMHDSAPGIARKALGEKPDTQPCVNRRAPALARKVKKSLGSDRTADRFAGSIRANGRYYLKDIHNPVTCAA